MRVPARAVVKAVAKTKNPGAVAGKLAGAIVRVKAPVLGSKIAPHVEAGVSKLVDKGVQKLQDPAFRKKVGTAVRTGVSAIRKTNTGGKVMGKVDAFRATSAGQGVERQVRRLGTNAVMKLNEFQTGQTNN